MFNVNKYKIKRDFLRLQKRVLPSLLKQVRLEKDDLPYRSALRLSQSMKRNITTQRYRGHWYDFTPFYKMWKQKHYPATARKFWIMSSSLWSSIGVYRLNGRWTAGLNKTSFNYADGKRIWDYAWENEKKRPVFTPSYYDFMARDMPKITHESTVRVSREWSLTKWSGGGSSLPRWKRG